MAEISKQFSNKTINIRLDDKNFVSWKQQVQLMIVGNGLESYIDGTPPPPEFIVAADGTRSKNPAFAEHRQVDAALASWLLSTISEKILRSLSHCMTARSIWTSLKPPSSTTRVMRLLTSLHSQRKGNLSMREYIDNVQVLCDSLASAGSEHKVSELVHICVILGGLGSEYESSISVITGSMVPFDLEATINLLLDAELRLQDAVNPVNLDSVALNASVEPHRNAGTPSLHVEPRSTSSFPPGRSSSGPRSSYYRPDPPPRHSPHYPPPPQNPYRANQSGGAGRGRGYYPNRTQCQLCGRFGHIVANCYHRHDKSYPGLGAKGCPPPIGANSAEYYDDQSFYASSADYYDSPQTSSGSSGSSPPAQAFHASSSSDSGHSAWYPDSGATNHLTNTSDAMTQSTPYKGTGPRNGGRSAGGH